MSKDLVGCLTVFIVVLLILIIATPTKPSLPRGLPEAHERGD
jgi:hypothetical protein